LNGPLPSGRGFILAFSDAEGAATETAERAKPPSGFPEDRAAGFIPSRRPEKNQVFQSLFIEK
jgi:hypothetical protein